MIRRCRHHFATLVLLLAVGALAGGCSTQRTGDHRPGQAAESASRAPGSYTVRPGDTVYSVARQYNLSVRSLIDANRLQPPFQLTAGQVLVLGTGSDYTVVANDTLLGISRKTGVPFTTLARMNNLSPPYVVRVGQRLKLPSADGTVAAAGPAVIESPAAAPVVEAPPAVATAPLAAPAPAVQSPSPVAAAPAAPAPAAAPTAQKGGGYTTLAERSAKPAAPASASTPAATPAATPAPAPAAAPSVPAQPPSAAAEERVAAAFTPPAAPPKSSKRGLQWPVKGQVIGEFGTTGKGQHNDGINIAVPRGTPVRAAEDGTVIYAGNELRGFGNLLLIKHADGRTTAYAHNESLQVKRGDVVRRGQEIAKVGDSGGVSQPQLHFEVRQGTRAVDPMTFLEEGATSLLKDARDPG